MTPDLLENNGDTDEVLGAESLSNPMSATVDGKLMDSDVTPTGEAVDMGNQELCRNQDLAIIRAVVSKTLQDLGVLDSIGRPGGISRAVADKIIEAVTRQASQMQEVISCFPTNGIIDRETLNETVPPVVRERMDEYWKKLDEEAGESAA